ncbi:hypothetical protein IJI69_00355 [Candidatus Saccharibacteria bacterium]|nr:hypothetical protein [Candidatus Saccharibacteria bacterium]MBQ6127140.1 hypothetical protein [Candidatus Saccharibacteria bacterium]
MAIKVYPLNNTLYEANDAQLMQLPVTSGVYGQKGNFDVTLNGNMTVTVSKGLAYFRIDTAKGFTAYMDSASTVTISEASTENPRIDRIVFRWKSNTNRVQLLVLTGTASANPTAPVLSRRQDQYDILLYDVYVDKGVTKIDDYAITDRRYDDSVCGIMANHAYKIDSSEWQSRITALIAAQGTQIQTAIDDRIEQVVENREIFPEYGIDYYNAADKSGLAQRAITELSQIYT